VTADLGAQPQAGPVGDDRRAFGRADWLLVSAIGLRGAYGLGMMLLVPVLVGPHPLLLELLSGSTVSEVVVGARVRLGEIWWGWAVLAGLPVWVLTDWLYWLAGRRWGDRALTRLLQRGDPERGHRRAAQVERVVGRLGVWGVLVAKMLPVPSQLVYAAAGTAGMRLGLFLVLNLLGTLAVVVPVVVLGYALGQRAVDVVEEFQQYAVLTAVVLAVVMALVVLVQHRRRGLRGRGAGETR